MATSWAFCTLTLSVHSSRPPTPKATRWSNTRGGGGWGAGLGVFSQHTVALGIYQI